MFTLGIKPDDCVIILETYGADAHLSYNEFFSIKENPITDTYIRDTVSEMNKIVKKSKEKGIEIELSWYYDNENEQYNIWLIMEAARTLVYYSVIGELMGQMSNDSNRMNFFEIGKQMEVMFTGQFIEHKIVKQAIDENEEDMNRLLKLDKNSEEYSALKNELYDKVLQRAIEINNEAKRNVHK